MANRVLVFAFLFSSVLTTSGQTAYFGKQGGFNLAAPVVSSISPTAAAAGSTGVTLNVTGVYFNLRSHVVVDGTVLQTTLVNSRTLRAVIPEWIVASPRVAKVTVRNLTRESNALTFTVLTPTLVIGSNAMPTMMVGVRFQFQLTAGGGAAPYSWRLVSGTLPSGLTLDANGLLYGAPLKAGSYSFTVLVTESGEQRQSATISFQANVSDSVFEPVPQPEPVPPTPTPLPTTAVYVFQGMPGCTLGSSLTGVSGALDFGSSGWYCRSHVGPQDLVGQPASGAKFRLGTAAVLKQFNVVNWTTNGASFTITTDAGESQSFTAPASGTVESLRPTSFQKPARVFTVTGSGFALDDLTFAGTVTPSAAVLPLAIVSTSLPGATVGQPYTASVVASGGTQPYSWSVSSGVMPAGLSLSSSGALSGTPSVSQNYSFSIQARDANGQSTTKSFSMLVATSVAPLSIATSSLPSAAQNTSYAATLSASGGSTPYGWSLASGSLPAGLSLSNGGMISGTPTTSGSWNCNVRVTDSAARTATRSLNVSVAQGAASLAITTASLPSATENVAYSQALSASGGAAPYSWALSTGVLPGGLNLGSNGTLSGAPVGVGTYPVAIEVMDNNSTKATAALTVTVLASVPTPPPPPPSGGYTPTCGLQDTAKHIPQYYDTNTFKYCTTPNCSNPIDFATNVPTIGAQEFYEPRLEGETTSFNCPLALIAGPLDAQGREVVERYSEFALVSEDDLYIALLRGNQGHGEIRYFSGPNTGQVKCGLVDGNGSPASSVDSRWLRGANQHKLITVQAPNSIYIWDADTCGPGQLYYTVPGATKVNMCNNEADISADGDHLCLNLNGNQSNPDVRRFQISTKTLGPQMQGVPDMDWCQLSHDNQHILCKGVAAARWDANTGALVNTVIPNTVGHADVGVLPDGTDVLISGFAGPASQSCAAPSGIGYVKWSDSTQQSCLISSPSWSWNLDQHYGANQVWPNPAQHGIIFDETDSAGTTSTRGVPLLSTWRNGWQFALNELIWCDLANPGVCKRLAHHRNLNLGYTKSVFPNLTRSGRYAHFQTTFNTQNNTVNYIVRVRLW